MKDDTIALTEWERRVLPGIPLVFCGVGNLCKHVADNFPNGLPGHPCYHVADNDTSKQGSVVFGRAVRTIDYAAHYYSDENLPDPYYVILINNGYSEVRNQLISLGVPEDRTLHWWTLWQHFGLKNADWTDVPPTPADGWLDGWSDEKSAQVLMAAYAFYHRYQDRTVPFEFANTDCEPEKIYFDHSLYNPVAGEFLIDGGAFTGDTLALFDKVYRNVPHSAISIEPNIDNFDLLAENCDGSRVVKLVHGALVGDPATMNVVLAGNGVSAHLANPGDSDVALVPAVTIDRLCRTLTPTLIKLDIEGSELDALYGGEETIKRCRPVIACCLYHRSRDLWEIPAYLKSICRDYHFYARCYSEGLAWETVMYAVPEERAV